MDEMCTFNHWIRDLEEFDPIKWVKKQDELHIEQIMESCFKGCTKEPISKEDAEYYYNDCIKEKMLYHYPEDSETLKNYIDAYNFLNKWK